MLNGHNFVENNWDDIEHFSISVDEIIEEVRRDEASLDATSKVLGMRASKKNQGTHAEAERLLRLLKGQGIETLNIRALMQQKGFLESQVRSGLEPTRVIGKLVDIAGRALAETYVLINSHSDTNTVAVEEPSLSSAPQVPSKEAVALKRIFENIRGKYREEIEQTGYARPGHQLDHEGYATADVIREKIEELFWSPGNDDRNDLVLK